MQKKMSFGLKLGFIGNALFVAFAIVTYIYYILYYETFHFIVKFLEILAYACDISGFLVLLLAAYFMASTIKRRRTMKIAFFIYILAEAFMMICELNSFEVRSFYDPYSHTLAIVHSIVAAFVCFSFLELDKDNRRLETLIIICVGIILGGMFGNVLGIRLYFGVFINAVSFTLLFGMLVNMLKKERLNIECYGERITEKPKDEYKNVFFDE